jgi:thiamine-phosphate pyrophosphorylase
MPASKAGPEKSPVKPIVCYVTDRKTSGSAKPTGSLLGAIRAAALAGVDWVQIRERGLPARDLLALARAARVEKARIVVNDRLDVALAAGVAGVHLGGASLPTHDVVRWCRSGNAPADFLIGVSCHSIEDVRNAEEAGASYVFFGPIFDTPSKKAFGPPQGVSRLAEVCRAARIPVIAIGGVNAENGLDCLRAGAAGIAAIRMFQESGEPKNLTAAIARLHGD